MNIFNKSYRLVFISIIASVVMFSCKDDSNQEIVKKYFEETKDLATNSKIFLDENIKTLNISKDLNVNEGIQRALLNIGEYYFSNLEYDSALVFFKKSNSSVSVKNKLLGDSYNFIGRTYFRLENKKEAIKFFEKAANIRKIVQDSIGYGTSLNNVGFLFWTTTEFDSAIIYFEKSLLVRRKLSNKEHLASTTNNIGTIYFQWGIYDKALEYYLEALKLQEERSDMGGEALMLTNIGQVYEKTNQNQRAIQYYSSALEKAEEVKDTQKIGYVFYNFGSAYSKKNVTLAENYYKKSMEMYSKIKYAGGTLIALEGLASTKIRTKNYDEAYNLLNQLIVMAKKENIPIRLAYAYNKLGDLALIKNDNDNAEKYFIMSNELSDKMSLVELLSENYKKLSQLYEKKNKDSKSLISLKKHNVYSDSLQNSEMIRRLEDLKKQIDLEKYHRLIELKSFENEKQLVIIISSGIVIFILIILIFVFYSLSKKRKESNKVLAERNSKIEKQELELMRNNYELIEHSKSRDKFYRIIAHDLRNPFVALYGYTEMLNRDYDDMSDDERKDFLLDLELATKKTHSLMENLLELATSKSGGNSFRPELLNIREIINPALEVVNAQARNKGIKIVTEIKNEIDVFVDRTMIDIVLRNLLTNAIKFSYSDSNIILSANLQDDYILFCVHDFGIGISEENIKKIFNIGGDYTSIGTNNEKGTGLGVSICKEFIEKHSGKIWVESILGKETKFYFTIPQHIKEANK